MESFKDFVSKKNIEKVPYRMVAWSFSVFTALITAPLQFIFGIPYLDQTFFIYSIFTAFAFFLSIFIYMKAIELSDLSVTLPMVAFTPVFMLLTSPIILGEFPGIFGILGIIMIVFGAYFLKIKESKRGLLQPFKALIRERGPMLMLIVAFIWSITGNTWKVVVQHSSVTFSIFFIYAIMAIFSSAWLLSRKKLDLGIVRKNFPSLLLIGAITTINELSLMTAITLTLAPFVVSVKRLSVLFGSLLGFSILKEKGWRERIVGILIMILGVATIYLLG